MAGKSKSIRERLSRMIRSGFMPIIVTGGITEYKIFEYIMLRTTGKFFPGVV